MNDEASLIALVQQGDARAYQELVRQYESIAFRAAFLITRNQPDATDVVQEAFVRAYQAIGSFKLDKQFRPWLLRIVTNLSINAVRSARRRANATQKLIQSINRSEQSPDGAVVKREQYERLLQAVTQLATDEQTLITLRYLLELPENEVAETLAIPLGTYKSRLHRTLAHLREIIQHDFADLNEWAIE